MQATQSICSAYVDVLDARTCQNWFVNFLSGNVDKKDNSARTKTSTKKTGTVDLLRLIMKNCRRFLKMTQENRQESLLYSSPYQIQLFVTDYKK